MTYLKIRCLSEDSTMAYLILRKTKYRLPVMQGWFYDDRHIRVYSLENMFLIHFNSSMSKKVSTTFENTQIFRNKIKSLTVILNRLSFKITNIKLLSRLDQRFDCVFFFTFLINIFSFQQLSTLLFVLPNILVAFSEPATCRWVRLESKGRRNNFDVLPAWDVSGFT